MQLAIKLFIFLALFLAATYAHAIPAQHFRFFTPQQAAALRDSGIYFSCRPGRIRQLESDMDAYLSTLGITPDMIIKSSGFHPGFLSYVLNTPLDDTSTLDLSSNPAFGINDEIVTLPAANHKWVKVTTVSRKEILLALLQHGRLTRLSGSACDAAALQEQVNIRQNITAWAENLNWIWPDGSRAKWNNKYWKRGTPRPQFTLEQVLNDAFMNQGKYSIGCYTATKLVVIQGVLDYFRRIKPDPEQLRILEQRLMADNEPLQDIEPGKMWHFEAGFDPMEYHRPGKILTIMQGVAPKNFVPGDWVYLLNTDPKTYQKTGYEGSSTIYLGRNKFSDYFNDHDHAYTYQQKLNEVYQWRNGVFSRIRHAAKARPLSPEDFERLGLPPVAGGIVTDSRIVPYFFGYGAFPVGFLPVSDKN